MALRLLTYLPAALRLRLNARQPRAKFEAARLQRFRALAHLAQQKSPYYAAIMRERQIDPSTCRPTDFPVLTKRLLHEHFDAIVTDRRITRAGITDFLQHSRNPDDLYLDEFVVLHTSGSSGEVGHFVFSTKDWSRGYAGLGRAHALKPHLRTRVAAYSATGGHFGGVTWSITLRHGLFRLLFDVATFEINAPFAETLKALNEYQPHIVGGYATGNKLLAEAQLAGRLRIHPDAIECGGEPLSPGDQKWLEQVFGCPCINLYGATETMLMGVARPGDPGMTLFDDDLIFEPAADHVLVTNLFNRTLPLIRYRMNDTLRPTALQSPYGHYPVIEPVVGRNEWAPAFRNRDGELDAISPHIINEIFVPGVWRFQLRWQSEAAFRFAVCLEPGLDAPRRQQALAAVEARLREILAQKRLDNVSFAVEPVEDIPLDAVTRKFRLIIRDNG